MYSFRQDEQMLDEMCWRQREGRMNSRTVAFLFDLPEKKITLLDCVWNVMAHAHKTDFVFRRNGRVHLNRQGRQFSRLLAAEACASALVMLDTPSSEVVRRVLATHSIRQFPLHFPSLASPCAITFQLDSTLVLRPVFKRTVIGHYFRHSIFSGKNFVAYLFIC
jgi:hypothetical protein